MPKCDICDKEHPGKTISCEACNKIVSKYKHKGYSMVEVRKALKSAHPNKCSNETYFRCAYTGVDSKFNSRKETLGTQKST